MSINKQIVITFILLISVIAFFGLTDVDLYLQDKFYNFQTHEWMVDKQLQPFKFLFYDGLKRAIILVGVVLIFTYLYSKITGKLKTYQRGLLIVSISAILIPVVVGGLKKTTNMPCPHAEIRYNGDVHRVAVWECYTDENRPQKKKACWPAGHASGGFALMSLFFLFRSRKNKIIALSSALIIAWTMGSYKMLVGDHFFSHTLITMLIAWLIILLTTKTLDIYDQRKKGIQYV